MLLLFDIDGTLVAGATEAHREALYAALLEVHQVDARTIRRPITPAGRTDGEIARAILLEAGIPAKRIDERADQVREQCCRVYAHLCPPDLSDAVIPGVPRLLDALSKVNGLKLGLLTGNYEPIARLKLARAKIGKLFPSHQGAFGSDSEDRTSLAPIARRRAGTRGSPYPREQTILIGDTPRDIACARADGLRCVAVATGPYPAEALADADAVAGAAGAILSALVELGALEDAPGLS